MIGKTVEAYAIQNYQAMFRQPEGRLKHPFLVPGSVYGNQLWDWDSWLTNVALRQLGAGGMEEYEKGCILNFLENTDEQGRMPIMISARHTIPYFSETLTNLHKPCLAQHAAFIVQQNGGDAAWLAPWFSKLLLYVDYYIRHCRHENGLYFWIDDSAIGVDNDPCTYFRPRQSSGSIYLNCLMYKELEAVCFLGDALGVDVENYRAEWKNLREAVQKHCYDRKDGFFYSVDLNLLPVDPNSRLHAGAPRHWDCLIQRIGVWSGFLAMWSGIATREQAERMVKENLLVEEGFWAPFGVRTLSKYEAMYSLKATGNPSCWLGPIWGISNYMVFRGLVKYGFTAEAKALAEKTLRLLEEDIEKTGQLHEYYHPETGEPIMNPGFQNWNLLSLNMAAWLRGEPVVTEF